MTNKEVFEMINAVAYENLERAQGMLDMFNAMNNTKHFFINRRVSYETVDHGVKAFHDAWVWAE